MIGACRGIVHIDRHELSRQRLGYPGAGAAQFFFTSFRHLLGTCWGKNVKTSESTKPVLFSDISNWILVRVSKKSAPTRIYAQSFLFPRVSTEQQSVYLVPVLCGIKNEQELLLLIILLLEEKVVQIGQK